jgi:hypothetical protein
MTRLTDFPGSFASLTETRLQAAMKIAALKMEIDRYQQLEQSQTESYVSRTEMRLTLAIKIAALKIEIDKYQELEKTAMELSNMEAANKVPPVPTPIQSFDKKEHHQNATKRDVKEASKTKISESDWVNKQARKLLGERDMKKRFTIK